MNKYQATPRPWKISNPPDAITMKRDEYEKYIYANGSCIVQCYGEDKKANIINEILATKRAWQNAERRKSQRRQKDGAYEDRKNLADALREGRKKERNVPRKPLFLDMPLWVKVLLVLAILLIGVKVVHGQEIDMKAIAQIESSNNPNSINYRAHAIGLYQVTPICLNDYNERHAMQYGEEELFEPHKAYNVAQWCMNTRIPQLLRHYHVRGNVRNRIWCWNAGIRSVIRHRMPKETRKYLIKYHRIEKSK